MKCPMTGFDCVTCNDDCTPIRDKGRGTPIADGGMSLRDWFAGQALAGLLAVPAFAEGPYADDMRAMRCYEYADAMLKARQS